MRMKGKKVIFNRKDTWSLYSTLNPVIAEGLKKFKEVVSDKDSVAGYPCDVQVDCFPDFPMETTGEQYQECFNKWLEIIDEMIYAFEDEANEPDSSDYDFEFNFSNRDYRSSNEYERYKKDQETHNKKVEKGLMLFSKYYKNLWW